MSMLGAVRICTLGIWICWVSCFSMATCAGEVDFRRDILPILSDKCFHCHGPDSSHRQAGLRLDDREFALHAADSGMIAIVPGKPESSELIKRIATSDSSELMPPADSGKPLTDEQKQLVTKWILQGAAYARHWSFDLPRKMTLPDVRRPLEKLKTIAIKRMGNWTINPIDQWVLHRLDQNEVLPSPRAPTHTLLRRLAFDITGLPPSIDLLSQGQEHEELSEQAYVNAVNKLLDSPHHGERMAMWWLDAARYADTDGYQGDATRTNWPWRDWVVQAFNSHMPYKQFTVEQFAGDLLPNATSEQVLATCFHRNHMTNGEGGRDPEESRVDYVIDRINTVGTVWLGLTLGCCQCHSHKFDPISQHDYYSLAAYFNSIDEDGKAGGGAKPFIQYRSPYAKRAIDEAQAVVNARKPVAQSVRQRAEQRFTVWVNEQLKTVRRFQSWHVLRPIAMESVAGTQLVDAGEGTVQAAGPNPRQDDYRLIAPVDIGRVTGLRLEILPHASHTEGKLSRGTSGEFILTDVKLQVRRKGSSQLRDIELASAVADVDKKAEARQYGAVKDTLDDDPRNGWTTLGADALQPHVAVYALAQPLSLAEDEQLVFVMLHRSTEGDANIGRFRLSVTDQAGDAVTSIEPMPMEQLAASKVDSVEQIAPKLRERLLGQFLADDAEFQAAQRALDLAQNQLNECVKAAEPLSVMVLGDRNTRRTTNVLQRGVWNQPGDVVMPKVLNLLDQKHGSMPPKSDSATQSISTVQENRLELANWLVSARNPLAARVLVNHIWQMFFGAGLVRTTEDFGLQGQQPTHPELLDWLAVELMENNWSIQHLIRIIVTSETYRQDSRVTADLLQRDPENRWLARGARYRLPSWMVRDAALAASGLLNPALGGPPVRPYQPEGVWEEMFMGRFHYEPSQGAAQYRRSLYAFWRRSIAPTYLFDSAQRRTCEVRVARTNTPLHALTILNDQTILDASLRLALAATGESSTAPEQIRFIFRRILSRDPMSQELEHLLHSHAEATKYYRDHPQAALTFAQAKQFTLDVPSDPASLAASLVIANLIFNLDEALTHE